MNGEDHINGKESVNGEDRLPVAPQEIGPADLVDVFDFNDTDDEFDFLDDDTDSSDEMEPLQIVPYQAVQFLVDAAVENQIVEAPGHMGSENGEAQEPAALSNDEEHEVKVDEQGRVPTENQLDKERNETPLADSTHRLIENQGQDLNIGSSASGKGQDQKEGSSASGRGQDQNGESFISGQDHVYERNGGQPGSCEYPKGEQVRTRGLTNCEEAMERLKIEDSSKDRLEVQPEIQVQDNLADQIEGEIQDVEEEEDRSKVLLELNGEMSPSQPPGDQLEKMLQMFSNEEAVVAPEADQEQVEGDIEADLNEDFVPDEQDNLVEEIEQEQAIPALEEPAIAEGVEGNVLQGELVGAIEERDNVVEEDGNAEVQFDPFIHMA